jgi:tetratricopeptide (TPR) repeat protein
LLFTGEPGIGKTCLADEAAGHAASRGMRVYWGRCFEDGGAPAYWPWIQILRGIIADAGDQHSRALPADIVRMLPELAAEAPRPEAGDAEQQRFRLFDAVARLLRESASAKPIMLVLDDLHDADVASLQLLKFVARVVHDARLIIVGTYRNAEMRHSQERAAIIADILRDARQLPLARLAEDEVGRMVEVRAHRPPDSDFVTALCRTTAGNPLFVDGIIRILAAEGRLGTAQSMALASYRLPDEVRAAIQRWLGLLSLEARTLLTTAALIGLEFEPRLLGQATATAPERVAELISSAQEMGIVISVGKSLCRFAHPLLREALSQEPKGGERVRLHHAIATALEEIQRADTQSHISLLAHYWRESAQSPEEIDKAIDYSIRAGNAAAEAWAMVEAVSRWDDAFRLNVEHHGDLRQRAEILVLLAGDNVMVGREREALKHLEDALPIYEQLGMMAETADVHRRLCGLLQRGVNTIDLPRAERHFHKAEALFRQMPPNKSVVQLYGDWSFLCLWRAQVPEAFRAASRAMEIAEELDNLIARAQATHAMAGSLFATGRLREALALEDRGWHEADLLNSTLAGGITQNYVFSLNVLGDHTEALKRLQREMTKPRNTQLVYYAGFFQILDQILVHSPMGEVDDLDQLVGKIVDPGLKWFGEAYLMLWAGELENASARFGIVVDNFRSEQRAESFCVWGHLLAYIRHWAGHQDAAIELLNEGLSYSAPGGYVPLEMNGRQCLSHIYAQTGRIEEARQNLARCREIMAAGEEWRGVVGLVSLSEAAIAVAEQKFDDSDRHFADALQVIRRYAIRWIEGPALCDWGRALSMAGQRNRALEKFDEAIELYRRIGAGQPWIDRAEADRAQVGPSKSHSARRGQTSLEALFRKEQDFWTIRYGEKLLRLKNSRGLGYIAQLLRYPEREIHALVLTGGAEMNGPGGAGEILDSTARSDYRHRIEELREDLEEAERFNDEGRAARARAEIEKFESHLAGAIGLGGRSRRASTDAERARVAVTKGIKAAIQQIRAIDPELGRHLSTAVSTGYFCCYHPDHDHPVSWQL